MQGSGSSPLDSRLRDPSALRWDHPSVKDGRCLGYGTHTSENGAEYQGQFNAAGQRSGRGTQTYILSSFQGKEDPFGERYDHHHYLDGGKYDGEWKDDKRHGEGTHRYADGSVRRGEWRKDRFVGKAAPSGKKPSVEGEAAGDQRTPATNAAGDQRKTPLKENAPQDAPSSSAVPPVTRRRRRPVDSPEEPAAKKPREGS